MNEPSTGDLSPEDQRVVDALVEHGFNTGALPARSPQEQRRVDAIQRTFALLDEYTVKDAEDTLLHATLARIDRHEETYAARMTLAREEAAGAATWRSRYLRMPDFISVAAIMLIAASIAWPLLNSVRQRSIDDACASNMAMLGQAFSAYAVDYGNALPVHHVTAGVGGWDRSSNVANLALLADRGYCEHGHLNCPGGAHHHGPSYSYQHQPPGECGTWGLAATTVVLSDRNPLIDACRAGRSAMPLSISLNHGRRGQNALSDDGSIAWLTLPKVGTDNIWLPNGVRNLRREDVPHGPHDVFLTH